MKRVVNNADESFRLDDDGRSTLKRDRHCAGRENAFDEACVGHVGVCDKAVYSGGRTKRAVVEEALHLLIETR